MKISISGSDFARMERLEKTRKINFRYFSLVSEYLNLYPTFVKEDYINELISSGDISAESAFCAALSVAMGLSTESEEDRIIIRKYLPASVKALDILPYKINPYYSKISFADTDKGDWALKNMFIAPYEGFIYNDPLLLDDYAEVPCIGFFKDKFPFIGVTQKGVEWMTLMPNETETLKNAVAACFGNVVTYGLGLGYFAFMASEKENVKSVTVIEKDKTVIDLFTSHILPQFPNKNKITVVNGDAFLHCNSALPKTDTDFVLADIWHDTGDGLEMYFRFRDSALLTPNITWHYWLEESMVAYLRWPVFSEIYSCVKSGKLSLLFGDLAINSFEHIEHVLSYGFLREHASEIGKFFELY